jgi:hypothetical protein
MTTDQKLTELTKLSCMTKDFLYEEKWGFTFRDRNKKTFRDANKFWKNILFLYNKGTLNALYETNSIPKIKIRIKKILIRLKDERN